MTVARDNFTRANSGSLGANWTSNSGAFTAGTYTISGNAAFSTGNGQQAASFWSANSFANNQYSEIVLSGSALGTTNHGGGPIVRATAGDNYYRLYVNLQNIASNIGLIKVVGGVSTALASATRTMALGDQIRMEIIGSTLNGYVNGVLVLTATDTSFSSGSPGIGGFVASNPTAFITAWEGGDIVPFAQTIQRDTFTRGNSGTLGANWTALCDATDTQVLGITSNAAQPQVVGGRATSYWNANTFANDQYSQALAGGSALGTNTHLDGVTVRTSAGTYYGFTWNLVNSGTTLSIFKVVSGTFTSIGAGIVNTVAVIGSLMRLEVVGTVLNAYVDGNLVLTGSDADIVSGAPGITAFMAAASPTANLTNWEGGSLLWKRSDTVIPIGANGGTEEPSVLYEANPQILSANPDGNIWKMWFTDGWSPGTLSVSYAESNDGVNWTLGGSVITGSDIAHGCVVHFGSTYYAFYVPNTATNNQFDLWQSANGKTGWSKTNTAVLSIGGVGQWDHLNIFNPYVFQIGSTYYMLYTGRSATNYSVGLATSPDLVTWTKSPSNPVIADGGSNGASPSNGKLITKSGNLYYLWGFGVASGGTNLPTDHRMWSSPDLITWTANSKNPTYLRVLLDEGTNLSSGQVADPSLVELNGTTFLFYDTITTQVSGKIHINMAAAPYSLLQLVGMITGTNIISGNVGRPGITINYSGTASGSVTSDAAGNYVIPITTNGSYTIAPVGNFSPPNQAVTVGGSDQTGINFSGSGASDTYAIGCITRFCTHGLSRQAIF